VIDGFGAQFVVPGFVAVYLAQPVLGAVFGQPRRGIEGPDVDRVLIEDGHAVRDDTVGLAKCTMVLPVKTVVRAVRDCSAAMDGVADEAEAANDW
jgi:hypothetical protein